MAAIAQFSSEIAAKNLRSDRSCRWPDGRASEARLEGLVNISLNPSFNFSTEDKIFTIGSCFAREIEKFMNSLGFSLPALDIKIPAEERSSSTANDILNKYSVHSMENELNWAFYGCQIPPEDFYLIAGKELWHDAQMVHNLRPASLEHVIKRRNIVTSLMRQIPSCRIIVLTLGLAEAWFDNKTGLYLNGMPPQEAINQDSQRFRLDVLSYDDILESLERIHCVLKEHGHPDFKMLLTVSPVPFKATFSGKDALIANMYSKSVQRAAAEAFALRHDNVDYFPSYEIVTLTERKVAYELDNIHVTEHTVAHIMSTVVSHYAPSLHQATKQKEASIAKSRLDVSSKTTLRARAKEAMSNHDYDLAITNYSALFFRFNDKLDKNEKFEALLNLGISMLRMKLTKEGINQLEQAKALMADHPRATYKLGLGYARAKMDERALEMFKEACRLNPNERDYHWRLGAQYIRLGNIHEGIESVKKALLIDPCHQYSLELIAKYAE